MKSLLRARIWIGAVAVVAATVAIPIHSANADTSAENDFVSRINGARSSNGLAPLAVHGELVAVARRWSAKMAASNRLSHNPNLQNEVTADWDRLGENVGVGGSVEQIHAAFMGSPGHRANILHREMSHVGVGVVITDDGTIWVTEVFMRLRGSSSAPPQTTSPPTTSAPRPPPAPRPTAAAPITSAQPRPAPAPRPGAATTTTARPAPRPDPEPIAAAPPPPPVPHARLVLVLEGLRQLDVGRHRPS